MFKRKFNPLAVLSIFSFIWMMVSPIMLCADGDDGGGGSGDDKSGDDKTGGDKTGDGKAGDGEGAEQYVARTELQKVIAQRDAAKDKSRVLAQSVADLTTKVSEVDTLKQQVESLKGIAEEHNVLKTAEEERKKKSMDATELMQHELNKAKGEVTTLKDQIESTKIALTTDFEAKLTALTEKNAQLMGFKLKSEIIAAASEHGAINPEQIVKLTKGDFKLNPDGEYVVETQLTKGGIKEVPVSEHIKSFLTDTANKNLVGVIKSPRKATEGDGGSGAHKTGDTKVTLTAAQLRDAKSKGFSEEEYHTNVIAPQLKRETALVEKRKLSAVAGGVPLLPGQVKI